MDTPTPTPIEANPTGAPIQPGQNLDNPTNTAQVPTKAPVVPATATAAPAITPTTQTSVPTAVVSSSTAADHVNNTIVPALTQAQQSIIDQNSAQAAAKANAASATSSNTTSTPATPPTPEETIANTPDTGNQWLYDTQGNRIQSEIGQPVPPGYSTINPIQGPTAPAIASVVDPEGNTYSQFSDGTYGKYNAKGQYVGTTTQGDFQTQQNAQTIQTQIQQLINGTFPLSAAQQAQVTAAQSSYQRMIDLVTQSTNSVIAGMLREEAMTGGAGDVTSLQTAANLITRSAQKIADINTEMLGAVGKMESDWNAQELSALKDDYDEYVTASKNRQDEIDNLNTQAETAQKDYQTAVQQGITNQLESDKFTEQQKQDLIDNAIKQGTLDNATKAQVLDSWYKHQDIFLRQQALNQTNPLDSTGGSTIPPATMNGDQTVNKQSQAQFLAGLPGGPTGDVATLIKGIADYSINPNVSPQKLYKGTSGLTQAEVVTLAKQYDPTYDQALYATRQSLIKDFTSGQYSQNINALNTAVGHISDILQNTSGLGNVGLTPFNVAKNTVASLFGSGKPGQANLNIAAATSEIATTFKGAGATDAEIKALGSIDANSSPDQVNKYIETATQLLASRLDALEQTYTTGMGKAPDHGFLSGTASNQLLKLQQAGLNIQVPELAKNPVVQLKTFNDSSPENAQLLQQLQQVMPQATPLEIINFLEDNGKLQ